MFACKYFKKGFGIDFLRVRFMCQRSDQFNHLDSCGFNFGEDRCFPVPSLPC